MAEFQEVMRQWVRLRKAIASSAEERVLSVYPLEKYDNEVIENIEKNVMAWAAEQPESVYPTWGEWFVEHGDLVDGWQNATNAAWMANTALDVFMKPIPADIAEKLGIEPKPKAWQSVKEGE